MQEQILEEALQKAVALLDTIDDRYRDAAFPIILQALIGETQAAGLKVLAASDVSRQEISAFRLPPSISVNEFFRKVSPSSHPERFVCAAYYLLHTGKATQFTQADILEVYGKLREPRPRNPSDVIYQCIKKAHLIDAPEASERQKSWVITPEGERFVEGLLNGNAASSKSAFR